jgi:hypothetical protein
MVNIIIQPHNTSCQRQDLVILEFQGGFNSSEVVDLSDVNIGNLSLNEVKNKIKDIAMLLCFLFFLHIEFS